MSLCYTRYMKYVVLLSSGLDSSVNLACALREGKVLLALTFDYGQKAAQKEILHSKALCEHYQVPHQVVDLRFFKDFTTTSLVNPSSELPKGEDVDIASLEKSQQTAEKVWVPNRNGIFLNIAGAYAEGLGADFVVAGFNKEEAQTFPDNSQEFLDATDQAFSFSTNNKVKTTCWTIDKDKEEMVRMGQELGLDFRQLWPCYEGGDKWCGQCESCLRFQRALRAVGLSVEGEL